MASNFIGLSVLVSQVKQNLSERFPMQVWIVAEISELNTNRTGHCYLELVEKDNKSDKIIAKCRATIWAFAYRMIKPYFESSTGETLRSGIKVLLRVNVEFHEIYGFSLNIQDIDPQYTLGDMAQKRAQTIAQLKTDGVINMNKSLELPMFPQRIAVVSSETAAGYGDFNDQLLNNKGSYSFTTKLFPALMQGNNAPGSIIKAFELIFEEIDNFDVVVVLRGGGSKSDLSCFDDYNLAYFITQFPMPVITGIGHDRDDSVTDIVANTKMKTPTAVAEFLIDKAVMLDNELLLLSSQLKDAADDYLNKQSILNEKITTDLISKTRDMLESHNNFLLKANQKIVSGTKQLLSSHENRLSNNSSKIKSITKSALTNEEKGILFYQKRIRKWTNNYLSHKEDKLDFYNSEIELLKPENTMKRGFAIVKSNNKLIKNANQLTEGNSVTIKLYKGEIKANVTDINKKI